VEVLRKNHPRFCSKYVRFIGLAETPRKQRPSLSSLNIGNQSFSRVWGSSDLNVGDRVFIAKEVPTLRGRARIWAVHEIILPEAYWRYESYEKDVASGRINRRKNPYVPYVETRLGHCTYIVGIA
jgi:hypothetical protein